MVPLISKGGKVVSFSSGEVAFMKKAGWVEASPSEVKGAEIVAAITKSSDDKDDDAEPVMGTNKTNSNTSKVSTEKKR